jgi:hypothetical protein
MKPVGVVYTGAVIRTQNPNISWNLPVAAVPGGACVDVDAVRFRDEPRR